MSASTEMSRLDSIPTEKLNQLLGLEGLPTVAAKDNGKVLMVVNGNWAVASIPAELPAVSDTDNGSVLTVADGEWKAVAPQAQAEG